MKNKITLVLFQLMLPFMVFSQNYSFSRVANCPESTYAPGCFAIGDSIYWVSGILGNELSPPVNMTQHVWLYNTLTNTWTQMHDFPGVAVYQPSTFVINGYGYLVNGWDSTTSGSGPSNLWQYNPATDTWTNEAAFPGSTRYTAASFSLNGKGYVGLGFTPLTNDFWQYDPVANSWTQKSNFPGVARQAPVFFTMGNSAYVGMGAVGNGAGGFYLQSDFYKYNPVSDTWTTLNIFPGNPVTTPYVFVINNDVYMVGGAQQNGYNYTIANNSPNVWKYTPANDTWSLWGQFPDSALNNGASASAGGSGYMGLGVVNSLTYQLSTNFYRFGPGVGTYGCTAAIASLFLNNASRNFEALGNFSPGAVLSWSFGDGGTGTGTSVNHSYTGDGSYVVTLTVKDNADTCTSTDTANVTINGISACSVSLSSNNFNANYTLIPTLTGTGPFTYLWNNGTTNFSVSPDPQVTLSFGDTATYCVTIMDSTGCQASACETIVGAPDTTVDCQTYLYIFPDGSIPGLYYGVVYHAGTAPIESYTWNFGDGTIISNAGDSFPSYTYNTYGFFDICLTIVDSDNCSSTYCDSFYYAYKVGGGPMNQFEVVPQSVLAAGISNLTGQLQLSVYPNPASDQVSVVVNNKIDHITIYSALGQVVMEEESPMNNTLQINTLASGIYFMDVRIGNNSGRVKFVKTNQ